MNRIELKNKRSSLRFWIVALLLLAAASILSLSMITRDGKNLPISAIYGVSLVFLVPALILVSRYKSLPKEIIDPTSSDPAKSTALLAEKLVIPLETATGQLNKEAHLKSSDYLQIFLNSAIIVFFSYNVVLKDYLSGHLPHNQLIKLLLGILVLLLVLFLPMVNNIIARIKHAKKLLAIYSEGKMAELILGNKNITIPVLLLPHRDRNTINILNSGMSDIIIPWENIEKWTVYPSVGTRIGSKAAIYSNHLLQLKSDPANFLLLRRDFLKGHEREIIDFAKNFMQGEIEIRDKLR